jgi:hypothetical protein
VYPQGSRPQAAARDTLRYLVTMPGQEPLSKKLSDKFSTGPQRSPTRRTLCGAVRGANSTLGKFTSQRKRCRQSPSRGPSQSGTSTWWDLSDKNPGASPTS